MLLRIAMSSFFYSKVLKHVHSVRAHLLSLKMVNLKQCFIISQANVYKLHFNQVVENL